MHSVIYKTQDAVFKFSQTTVKDIIINNENKYDIEECDSLLNLISIGEIKAINIPEEPVYFNELILDLIGAGHGSIICNTCNKTYTPRQLKPIKMGIEKDFSNIQNQKKGIIKHLFTKNKKPPSISGSERYLCPDNHILVSGRRWKLF